MAAAVDRVLKDHLGSTLSETKAFHLGHLGHAIEAGERDPFLYEILAILFFMFWLLFGVLKSFKKDWNSVMSGRVTCHMHEMGDFIRNSQVRFPLIYGGWLAFIIWVKHG